MCHLVEWDAGIRKLMEELYMHLKEMKNITILCELETKYSILGHLRKNDKNDILFSGTKFKLLLQRS